MLVRQKDLRKYSEKITLTDSALLMRGLEFSGSLLNVILSDFKNMFIPVNRL